MKQPHQNANPSPLLHDEDDGPILTNTKHSQIPTVTMKKKFETVGGFSRALAQDFLHLRRQAEKNRDEVSLRSLQVILDGIMDLTSELEAVAAVTGVTPRYSPAYRIFSDLALDPNDPVLLRRAGSHYLIEWHQPHAALRHFETAYSLSSNDETLPMLIEIATLAVKRKVVEAETFGPPKIVSFNSAKPGKA